MAATPGHFCSTLSLLVGRPAGERGDLQGDPDLYLSQTGLAWPHSLIVARAAVYLLLSPVQSRLASEHPDVPSLCSAHTPRERIS